MWKFVVIIGALVALAGLILFFYQWVLIKKLSFSYGRTDTVFYNPMMGFAPNADYVEAVGENTLVYVDVTWRELEPEEGQYDFAGINEENYLDTWRSQGKKAVFRFVCDNPSQESHLDIPDWLYEKTKDGTFYDTEYGKGYSPDYRNETFIAYHERAIKALGEEYGQDSFFCYIELGSVGHWGEWHVKYDEGIGRIPPADILWQYVKPYTEAFPNAKILMRRPFEWVSAQGFGVYNDMTGAPEDTKEWLSWIEAGAVYDEAEEPLKLPACPKIWESAPVGGEFTSSISMEEMLGTELERTLSLLEQSHVTFLGPKCPIACGEELQYPKETEAVRGSMGYRYGVSGAEICYDTLRQQAKVQISLNNYGVAPMYFDWPVCIYALDEEYQIMGRYETDIRLSEIAGGESAAAEVWMDFRETASPEEKETQGRRMPVFAVGVENPETGKAEVYLDMDTIQVGMYYILNET